MGLAAAAGSQALERRRSLPSNPPLPKMFPHKQLSGSEEEWEAQDAPDEVTTFSPVGPSSRGNHEEDQQAFDVSGQSLNVNGGTAAAGEGNASVAAAENAEKRVQWETAWKEIERNLEIYVARSVAAEDNRRAGKERQGNVEMRGNWSG